MATMSFFREILNNRGLEAAANYATVAKFGPGLAEVRRLREEERNRPKHPGKTDRDRKNGSTARWQANHERRRLENQMRCRQIGGGKKDKKAA